MYHNNLDNQIRGVSVKLIGSRQTLTTDVEVVEIERKDKEWNVRYKQTNEKRSCHNAPDKLFYKETPNLFQKECLLSQVTFLSKSFAERFD